jgi:hypothetical protein
MERTVTSRSKRTTIVTTPPSTWPLQVPLKVWMSTARRGLDAHQVDPDDRHAPTACGRSTRTGIRLQANEARERYGARPCPRCWPDGGPPELNPPPPRPNVPALVEILAARVAALETELELQRAARAAAEARVAELETAAGVGVRP